MSAAQADLIRITPTGVSVSDQAITEPVPIGADGFRTSFWGGGSADLLDPLILILATPTPGAAPGLTFDNSSAAFNTVSIELGGTNVYGGTWDSGGFGGTYDENSSKDSNGGQISVYEFLGFTPDGSNSQNYTNWSGATGLSSWDLWIFKIAFDPDLAQGEWVEFAATGLTGGSYVVGYGCTRLNTSDGSPNCSNEGSTQSTPFTFAGLVTTVPEPGTLALVGAGLLALGFSRRASRR